MRRREVHESSQRRRVTDFRQAKVLAMRIRYGEAEAHQLFLQMNPLPNNNPLPNIRPF